MVEIASYKKILGDRLHDMVTTVMERSNNLKRTTHVTARLIKCHFNACVDQIKEELTVEDIQVARHLQFVVSMEPVIKALNNGDLDPFRPFMERGIIYIRGRCGSALPKLLGLDKLPVLPRDSRLAKLIVWEAHYEDHRLSPSDVLARSRRTAWIIRGRYLAREVCKMCPVCKLKKRNLTEQLMGDIPKHQLQPCPPFSFISLDFAGPYVVKSMGNSRALLKVWGLVIICQNTRAIKMLATAGYSTDEFLTTYTRFTSNYGCPVLVVSDAGSQLAKAGKLINEADPARLDWKKIREGAAKNGTKWHNVEAGCQWRNGLAESAVKLVKSTLDLTIASQKNLNYTELDTLFSSVANIVNNRPIAAKSITEDDFYAITPNDLLLQRGGNRPLEIDYVEEESVTKRQQVMRELEKTWWDQWIVQALPSLIPYKKWRAEKRSLRVGDLVLVLYGKKIGKGDYRLARVTQVHPDEHNVVRTVTVGMRKRDSREAITPYVPKPLEELRLGVQRLVVISPIEEQLAENVDTVGV